MMGKTFRVSLYTTQNIAQPRSMEALWQALGSKVIAPHRFDSIERARMNFDSNSHVKAREIYSNEGMLFVRGAKDSFTAMFTEAGRRLSLWNFWWDVKAMDGRRRQLWLDWLFDLCRSLPPHYGFGCSTNEYDAKHILVESGPTGSVTRGLGISTAEFFKFLPGLHWLTIFGTELTGFFGSTIEPLPHSSVIRISPSQTAIVLDGKVVPETMDQRLQIEAEISDVLGEQYFFDRNRAHIESRPVPNLLSVLVAG